MDIVRALAACLLVASGLLPHSADAQDAIEVEVAFPSLGSFNLPVDLAADGNGYLYLVEQTGKVFAFLNDDSATERALFLDLSARVHVAAEAGLLSLAFHPSYSENGYFYVYYIVEAEPAAATEWKAVLSRFTRSESNPLIADPESELILLEIPQPTDRHNAGETAFGPEGYLYLSLGDGSKGGDAFDNSQNLTTLLGSILRIDVDHPSGGRNYGIPPDNPFAGHDQGYREEIYAYGFRNPWRFSIDALTGHMWVGDVGETSWEEVDFVVKGGNYGWPLMEGHACFDPPRNCSGADLLPPSWTYPHDNGRLSVIGGYVYRGRRVPDLVGRYIFADWGGRELYALDYGGMSPNESDFEPDVTEIVDTGTFISGFGIDETNELYMLLTFHDDPILRFAGVDDAPDGKRDFELALSGPNPARFRTAFSLTAEANGNIRIVLYDVVGRQVAVLLDGFVSAGTRREVDVDVGELSSGVYFVRALSPETSFVTKIVVSK
jgi:glucose/arabinose dehydrogenase